MKHPLATAITLSAIAHILIIAALTGLHINKDLLFGDGNGGGIASIGGDEVIEIEVMDSSSMGVKAAVKEKSSTPSFGKGSDEGFGSGDGSGIGSGTARGNIILTQIRKKIERSKFYPPDARRNKIEGKTKVEFSINKDGTLAFARIKESSGNKMLDEAALETLKRAQPLPYFEESISASIKFSIED